MLPLGREMGLTMRVWISSISMVLAACASSGIIPIGQETYMVTKQSTTGFHSASSVKAEIFPEAAAFCAKLGKEMQPVADSGIDGVPGRSFASAELTFRCLAQGDAELGRPTPRPVANVRVEQAPAKVSLPPAAPAGDTYTELLKLKSLLDTKIITQDEFDQQKKKILAR